MEFSHYFFYELNTAAASAELHFDLVLVLLSLPLRFALILSYRHTFQPVAVTVEPLPFAEPAAFAFVASAVSAAFASVAFAASVVTSVPQAVGVSVFPVPVASAIAVTAGLPVPVADVSAPPAFAASAVDVFVPPASVALPEPAAFAVDYYSVSADYFPDLQVHLELQKIPLPFHFFHFS